MKTESRNTFIAYVVVLILNCIVQALMPEGKFIIAIASVIVMIGADKLIKAKDDFKAEKLFRKICIAFIIYQLIIGAAPLMFLFCGGYFIYRYYKKRKQNETDSETEKKVN